MKKPAKKKLIVLFSVTAIVLAMSAISFMAENSFMSNTIGVVASPLQKGTAVAVNSVKTFFNNIADSGKNAQENKKLKAEISELRSQIRMLEGHKTENEKLHTLLQFSQNHPDLNYVGANVIGRESSEFNNTITIDKGTKDGIKKNAVVTTAEGLVGVVYEAMYNYSKVKTIFDSDSAISAICPRSGDMGIVESTGDMSSRNVCSMNYIDKAAKTVVGDMIETSGTGGIFPKGILIGKVTKINEDKANLTLTATVEVSVNLNNTSVVLVSK